MDKDPKNQKFKLEDYREASEPSWKMINFGLWLTENRRRIIKILVALLIFSAIGFFVYSAYGYIYYFLVGRDQDKSLTENFTQMGLDIQQLHLSTTAIPLQVSAPLVFVHNNKTDLAVDLKNPNPKHAAFISYCFEAGSTEFGCGSTFLLPNTEKYAFSLNQDAPAGGNYQFAIKSTSWQRVDNRKYPDWPSFYAQANNMAISSSTFSVNSGGIGTLNFVITNNSPYSYWEVPLNITLNSGGAPVAVNRFLLEDLKSLESRPVSISWETGSLPGAQPIVTPDLNILDDSIFQR